MKLAPQIIAVAATFVLVTGCGTVLTPVDRSDDAAVQSIMRLKTALIDDDRVDAAPIRIRQVDDRIVIDGFVEREQQIRWIRETARHQVGDYPVTIQLKVR